MKANNNKVSKKMRDVNDINGQKMIEKTRMRKGQDSRIKVVTGRKV